MRRRSFLGLAAAGTLASLAGAGPRPWALASDPVGDRGLIRLVSGRGLAVHSLSVVHVTGDRSYEAHWRAAATTVYEVGSVTKALTGLALADAVTAGRLNLDDTLGRFLDLRDAPAASVRFAAAASHTSGLPRGARAPERPVVAPGDWSAAYTASVADLEADARAAVLGPRSFAYSNLGGALVGQATARAWDLSYPNLLRERVFAPLGMAASAVQTGRAFAPGGFDGSWRARPPWVLDGYAPMGGAVSTPADLTRLVRALVDQTAPGMAALEPREPSGDNGRMAGLFWDVQHDVPGRTIASHPGGTPGYSAYLGVDRERGSGVIVLADGKVDAQGLALWVISQV